MIQYNHNRKGLFNEPPFLVLIGILYFSIVGGSKVDEASQN